MYNWCEFCNEKKPLGIPMAVYSHPDENQIGWEDCIFCCMECHPEFFDKKGNIVKQPIIEDT